MRLVQVAVGSNTWEKSAWIRQEGENLVVHQRPKVQEQVTRLVDQLGKDEKADIVARCVTFDEAGKAKLSGPLAEAVREDFRNGAVLLSRQQADQANSAATLMAPPHLTLYNGQRAYVLIATQREYVAPPPKENGGREVKYDPRTKTAESGILMDCQPLIGADGRSIVLAVHSRMSTFLDFDENRLWPNTRPEQKLFYQRPVMATRDLRFLGTVPVGMTLAVPFDPVVKTPADSKVQMDAATKRRAVMLVKMEIKSKSN